MTKFFIDDSIIIDAWLMVLHRNSEQDKRLLRMLNRDDIRVIHEIRRELAGLWATQRGKESSYKKMRDEYLDQQAKRDGWSQETRNLYASILSTIGNWSRAGGRDERAQAELIELWKGAGLILLFSDLPIQGQLQL